MLLLQLEAENNCRSWAANVVLDARRTVAANDLRCSQEFGSVLGRVVLGLAVLNISIFFLISNRIYFIKSRCGCSCSRHKLVHDAEVVVQGAR